MSNIFFNQTQRASLNGVNYSSAGFSVIRGTVLVFSTVGLLRSIVLQLCPRPSIRLFLVISILRRVTIVLIVVFVLVIFVHWQFETEESFAPQRHLTIQRRHERKNGLEKERATLATRGDGLRLTV